MVRTRSNGLLLCTLAAACGSAPLPPLPAPPDGTGVQLQMLSRIDPGQEIERCQFFQVPPGGLQVNRASVRYTAGSHHVLLYTTPYTSIPTEDRRGRPVDTSGVFDCARGASADWKIDGVAAGAQSSDAPDIVDLPPDVAMALPEGSVLLMNTHYLNASSKPLDTDARINLYTIPREQVKQAAGVLFFYNGIIRVPAKSKASARMSCPITRDITLVNAQSHMHRHGVGYVADLVDGSGQRIEELYKNDRWEDVFVKRWAPGKPVSAGTAIDYRCDYDNDEDRTVLQGLTTDDEMCMFIGLYYPRDRKLELCATADAFSTANLAATHYGSGTATCADTLFCMQGATSADTFSACVADSCPQAAAPMSDLIRCQATDADGACSEACNGGGTCVACLLEACKTTVDACLALPCD